MAKLPILYHIYCALEVATVGSYHRDASHRVTICCAFVHALQTNIKLLIVVADVSDVCGRTV